MSCDSAAGKDCSMETKSCALSLDAEIDAGKSKKDGLTSCCWEKDEAVEHHQQQRANLNSTSLDLFRKYLFTKAPNKLGKTNEEESEAIAKAPPRPLVPQKVHGGRRSPSLLELSLLPGISRDSTLPTSSGDRSSHKSQLTVFYAGEVNVYEDVPFDKAQAIMHLAGKVSAPVVANVPKADMQKPLVHQPSLPSLYMLQADLPIARKLSLQRFLEKRRDRIINKSPYASSNKSMRLMSRQLEQMT